MMVERKLDEVIVILDRLGPETPEMRAERKASPAMRTFNKVIVALVLIIAALVIWASGVFVGAMQPTVWNHLPFVVDSPCDLVDGPCRVVPSGERAEPEESAK